MGSSSSKPSSVSESGSRPTRTKRSLSSLFFCGAASSSRTHHELEEHPEKSPVKYVGSCLLQDGSSHSSNAESSLLFASEVNCTSSELETGTSSGSSSSVIVDNGETKIGASNGQRHLSQNKEPIFNQPPQELVTQDATVCMVAAADTQNSVKEGVTISCSDDNRSNCMEHERQNSGPDGNHDEDQVNVVMTRHTSDSRLPSVASNCIVNHQSPMNENPQVATQSSHGFVVADRMQDPMGEDILHVDMVSISSNILSSGSSEISNGETRRNSRRLFWDAFSRRSSRRHNDSPSIVFASGDADDLGSRDRWHFDLSGDMHRDGVGDGVGHHSSARAHQRNERRWLLRSEMSDRVLRGLGDGDQQVNSCASGLHPDGSCSCESIFTVEEFSTLASISRIIMLAEALFEVLEELYQQPFSLSLSMPAPESVVDSFPVKYHKKVEATESESGTSDMQQCYICLADYEEGDRLRVLPCHHEYHACCIDKWLKEINRVCPLCRRNICEDFGRGSSASNTEVSSQ